MICQKYGNDLPLQAGTRRRVTAGFTIIELVVALILLGIFVVVLVGRYASSNASAVTEADVFKSALRYAQARAMADIYTWGISITSNTTYALVTENPHATGAVLPDGSGTTHTLASGVTFTSGVGSVYRFDWRGQPVLSPINDPSTQTSTPATGQQTITLTQSSPVTVVITPYTGFIP